MRLPIIREVLTADFIWSSEREIKKDVLWEQVHGNTVYLTQVFLKMPLCFYSSIIYLLLIGYTIVLISHNQHNEITNRFFYSYLITKH